jgi:hypothetical protein
VSGELPSQALFEIGPPQRAQAIVFIADHQHVTDGGGDALNMETEPFFHIRATPSHET